MITVNSDGNPLSQAFLNAIEQPLVGFGMKVFRNGSDTGWGVKRASIDLGAGDADMGLADFELGTVCSAQAELQLYGGTPSVGEVLQLRVGVDIGGSYEYVTVANVAATSVSVFGGISTVQCVGRWASRLNRPIASGTMSAAAAASAIGTAGGFSVAIGEFQSTSQTVDVEGTVRDALSALAKRLGGFAVETPEGYLVAPFQRTPTYALPASFATSAPRITGETFTADGLEVITAETSFTYGTGRVKCDDPTATAETSAVTWGNIQGYSYQPGNVRVAIIDPRVTPADLISVTVDGTAWNLPARGISITYDGGYFGTYSAAGLTLTMEESLVEGELTRAASTAKALAQEAQAVAEAVNQHFWDDDSGAHVTEVTKEEWLDPEGPLYQSGANSLWNSLGMLFRKGLTNLMALVVDDPDDEVLGTTGVAIYDGQGNASGNIVASFTNDGIQVGKDNEQRININSGTTTFYNEVGSLVGVIGEGQAAGVEVERSTSDNYSSAGFNVDVDFSPLPDFALSNVSISTMPSGLVPGVVYFSTSFSGWGTNTVGSATVTIAKVDEDSWRLTMSGTTTEALTGSVYARYRASGLPTSTYVFGTGNSTGMYAFSEGYGSQATGHYSHAEGYESAASGDYSHAEGNGTTASGYVCHAEGRGSVASGMLSHAEGDGSVASGVTSHAEGSSTASGQYSHAEGDATASGSYAHAEGYYSEADGGYSHAGGYRTIAKGHSQVAIGTFNVADGNGLLHNGSALIIGNGTSDTSRSNAFTVDWSGNVDAAGGVTASGGITTTGGASIVKDSRLNRDGTVTATQWSRVFGVQDKDGELVGYIQAAQYNDGRILFQILACNEKSDGTQVNNSFGLIVAKDGTTSYSIANPEALRTALGKYTRSSVGALDWGTNNDYLIAKSALAYWNGAYSGTTSNLAYCNKGAFGTLATKSSLAAADIPSLDAGKITSGTFDAARIPSLAASKITSGTFARARIENTAWAYLVGSASTVASGNYVRWRMVAGIVFLQVYYRSGAGLAAGSAKSIGNIPANYRPSSIVESTGYLGAGNASPCDIWVETNGNAYIITATAASSKFYGTLSYPLG